MATNSFFCFLAASLEKERARILYLMRFWATCYHDDDDDDEYIHVSCLYDFYKVFTQLEREMKFSHCFPTKIWFRSSPTSSWKFRFGKWSPIKIMAFHVKTFNSLQKFQSTEHNLLACYCLTIISSAPLNVILNRTITVVTLRPQPSKYDQWVNHCCKTCRTSYNCTTYLGLSGEKLLNELFS